MSVFFRRRGEPPAIITMIAVTITGAGDPNECFAIINGTRQYEAGTHEVNAGDVISFVVSAPNGIGWVKIDGTEVIEIENSYSSKTYHWMVPSGISTVEITIEYEDKRSGKITVTTA